ncbi:hypothetical protein ABK040_011087 [Willaertia magna]
MGIREETILSDPPHDNNHPPATNSSTPHHDEYPLGDDKSVKIVLAISGAITSVILILILVIFAIIMLMKWRRKRMDRKYYKQSDLSVGTEQFLSH